MIGPMRASRWAIAGVASLILAGACTVGDLAEGGTGVGSPAPPPTAAVDDPAEALTGRAVEALGEGGTDVVMRIGAEGFRLPDGEKLYNLYGDRVLSVVADSEGGNARMMVRDLGGAPLHAFDAGMQVPQTGIVRGDAVYFGGIDLGERGDPMTAMDRGAWVARGDAPPESIVAARQGLAIYQAFELSPDGRTVGVSHCWEDSCATTLLRQGAPAVEIPKAGLIALTNEVALLIGQFSDVTAYAVADGAELWRAETEGTYYDRYATSDGTRIVISSIEDAGDEDGNSTDQLRLEVMDALTGVVERAVLVPTDDALFWVARSLSTDRYVALLDSVLPNADEGPHAVRVVDLEAGRRLDVELMLGDVP